MILVHQSIVDEYDTLLSSRSVFSGSHQKFCSFICFSNDLNKQHKKCIEFLFLYFVLSTNIGNYIVVCTKLMVVFLTSYTIHYVNTKKVRTNFQNGQPCLVFIPYEIFKILTHIVFHD